MFEIKKNINELFKYYKTLNVISSYRIEPQITTIKGQPFLLIVNDNSFHIYNLQNLSLQFMGPFFKQIDCVIFSGHRVILSENTKMHVIIRGEIRETYEIGRKIKGMYIFEEFLVIIKENNEINFYEVMDDERCFELNDDVVNDNVLNNINNDKEINKKEFDQVDNKTSNNIDDKYSKEIKEKITNIYSNDMNVKDNKKFDNKMNNNIISDNNIKKETSFKFLFTKKYNKNVVKVIHPYGYINKIIIVFEDGVIELFNVNRNKIIYEFDLGIKILAIAQTSVTDIVGILLCDGTIKIYNLKKNKVIFEIYDYKGDNLIERARIYFNDKFMMVTGSNKLSIYNLEVKKEVFKKNEISGGLFVNEDVFLMVTENEVSLYELDNFTLWKRRQIFREQVENILVLEDGHIRLCSKESIFDLNVYRDEQNRYIKKYIKISALSQHNKLVLYGNGEMSSIDEEGRYSIFLRTHCDWIKTYRDFIMFGKGCKCFIMNICSKRIILEIEEKEQILDGHFEDTRIVLLCQSEIIEYNYKKKRTLLYSWYKKQDQSIEIKWNVINKELNQIIENKIIGNKTDEIIDDNNSSIFIKFIGNLIVLKLGYRLFIICENKSREYKADKFFIDVDNKYMAIVYASEFFLYDFASGCLIEHIIASISIKDAVFLDNLKFLIFVDINDDIHLFVNQSLFIKIENISKVIKLDSFNQNFVAPIVLEQKNNDFKEEIGLYKYLPKDKDLSLRGLNKKEVTDLLKILFDELNNNFNYKAVHVLNKLLLYKGKSIKKEEIIVIKQIIKDRWDNFDINLTTAVGSLRIQDKK